MNSPFELKNKPNIDKLISMINYDLQLAKSLKFATLLICYYLIFVQKSGQKLRPIDFRRYIHETIFEEPESKSNKERNQKILKKVVYSGKKLVQHQIIESEEVLMGLRKETYYFFIPSHYYEQDLEQLYKIISSNILKVYLENVETNQVHYYSTEQEIEGIYRYFNALGPNADEMWLNRTFRLYDIY